MASYVRPWSALFLVAFLGTFLGTFLVAFLGTFLGVFLAFTTRDETRTGVGIHQ